MRDTLIIFIDRLTNGQTATMYMFFFSKLEYKYNLNSQKKNQYALSLPPPTFVEFTLHCHSRLKSKYTTHHSTMPLLY